MNPATSTPASPPPASPGRNAYIDTLRGGSILGVVCIHFAGSFVTTDRFAWSPSFYLGLTLNQVFIFAVPLFIFLSGVLAGASTKVQLLSDYYRSRLWRIGFPYLLASIASFFLLNHYPEWLAVPGFGGRLSWLASRFFLSGIEPTLYFIPLILYLYLLQPALKALPGWLNRLVPAVRPQHFVLALSGLLLVLHLTLGLLCYRSTLNYYTWGRPDPLFWMFYFFSGLHYRTIVSLLSPRTLRMGSGLALVVAVIAMTWNFIRNTDIAVVGVNFERNVLDFAYVRPEMLVYDLAMVFSLGAGIALGWNTRATLVSWLGRYTLEIYLWHILVLYYGAWRYADATASCRQLPEVMVLISIAAALLIAGLADGWDRLKAFFRHHRLVLVKVDA
ncbi:MAG: acyltransferase [Lacunisphaera sp.]|nr:acyltransferase [Lacunisphaera sp.]